MYVDDWITGQDTREEALLISLHAENIMKEAGMEMRKWISNDTTLMSQWAAKGFDTYPVDISVSLGSNKTKVLGLAWQTLDDCLTLDTKGLQEFISTNKNTKRFLLQAIGKIFDPLGLISPFTIRMKCLIQELWKNKITWDEELPPKIVERFIFNCKNPGKKKEGPLTSEEMMEAEYFLLKQEQLMSFHTEMTAMRNGDDICHKSNPHVSSGRKRLLLTLSWWGVEKLLSSPKGGEHTWLGGCGDLGSEHNILPPF
ncbi:integrase catalytic domain-containing protein [Nephila pilipes]|uniref:Integrase catalytic domain-containing protein n=1 Tax=Nephila pilipes TaxID=299642 RepID=A0A8X6UHD1_NEPPI|nr:integrase catalytic domain-containing protein [Nephila pilipes]